MGSLYRCVGEVVYNTVDPHSGKTCRVALSQNSQSWSFLQCLQTLTPSQPAFSVHVKTLGPQSKLIVGIAGNSIEENRAPGHWNNTVGYHSDTGKCYSSHDSTANTGGEPFGLGDKFSVVVSYFGKKVSTVIFYKNDVPVATRYLFEADHTQFYPCLYLDKGPAELDVKWLDSGVQKSSSILTQWIRSPTVSYDTKQNLFSYDRKDTEAYVQGTLPLGIGGAPYYDVTVEECSPEGVGPTVAIATCSPLKPTPPCVLLRDYLKWEPSHSVKVGDHIGWGVHHSPEHRHKPNFNPRTEQIVLCYVIKNQVMQCFRMMLQPAGGFYPMVLLNQNASKVSVQSGTAVEESLVQELDKIYTDLLKDIRDMLETDAVNKRLTLPMFRLSEALLVDISSDDCHVTLPRSAAGIHAIQFLHPLSKDSCYFYVEVNKLAGDSSMSIGVAGPGMSLSQSPGSVPGSVGLTSNQGQLLSDNHQFGNTEGEKFSAGDRIGVQISHFADNVTVVLFFRNERPIGTRYLRESDRNKYLPTVSFCANGSDVDVNIVWQTRVERAPLLNPVNLEHWCLPEGATVDSDNIVNVIANNKKVQVLQCSSSLNTVFNHYEVKLIDAFDDCAPPPVLALCAASPQETPNANPLTQDYIRFWPTGKAAMSAEQGDYIGWGILFPESRPKGNRSQDFVVCYLTLNRTIVLRRVLVLPPGGFYPVVILPAGADRVKFEFAACCIEEAPLSTLEVQELIDEAQGKLYANDAQAGEHLKPQIIEKDSAAKAGAHRRTNSASYSLNSEGLSDEENSVKITDSMTGKEDIVSEKPPKGKKDKKQKKQKKKETSEKSKEKKLKRSSRHYDEDDITDQYQSKSCVIL